MPELPEVETIKNELSPHIIGRSIVGVTLLWEKMLLQPSLYEFYTRIRGRKMRGLKRRGKYLIFELDNGDSLIIHLRMSGSLIMGRDSIPEYTRAIVHLGGGTSIFFRDPRKFGKMQLVEDDGFIIRKLGPEPLEASFTAEIMAEKLKRRKAPVKAVLIDQASIAGIGNMYADEALFVAKIHPLRPAHSLLQAEINRLYKAIQAVLVNAIDRKGASVNTYFRPGGEKGTAHSYFKVAHQKGKICPICKTPIERISIHQRGSCYCPRCQPAKG
jgi:formamidopyrimidine-DNA glycosylase